MKKSKIMTTMTSFAMGAVTGMMLAPKEGKELRKDVKDGANKALKKVKKVKKEECEMVKGVTSEVKDNMKDIGKIVEE